LLIAILMLLLNWVNTTGEYILGSVVEDSADAAVASGAAGGLTVADYIGKFYSDFFAVVNLAGLLIQLFLVSRIVKLIGVSGALLVLPIIALGAYTLLAFYPVLAVVRWAKTAENSTDYSLNNTVRNMLFLPTTREQKYKAKQAIDSFFWRTGDVLSALLVFVGTTFLAWQASNFAVFNIGLVVIWLAVAVAIGRRYNVLVREGRPPA
jgi:AAA family ATP:ADP antiporter